MSDRPVKLLTPDELDDLSAGSRQWRAATHGPPILWSTFDRLVATARATLSVSPAPSPSREEPRS